MQTSDGLCQVFICRCYDGNEVGWGKDGGTPACFTAGDIWDTPVQQIDLQQTAISAELWQESCLETDATA